MKEVPPETVRPGSVDQPKVDQHPERDAETGRLGERSSETPRAVLLEHLDRYRQLLEMTSPPEEDLTKAREALGLIRGLVGALNSAPADLADAEDNIRQIDSRLAGALSDEERAALVSEREEAEALITTITEAVPDIEDRLSRLLSDHGPALREILPREIRRVEEELAARQER